MKKDKIILGITVIMVFLISFSSLDNQSNELGKAEVNSELIISAPEDPYEDNDFYTSAYNISSYNATWLSTISGNGSQHDDDYFEIYIPTGYERVYVYVNFTHVDGDIDFEFLDNGGSWIDGSYGGANFEELNMTVSSPGTYYIYVYGPGMGNEYDIYWECTPPPPDDSYEPNNDYTIAYNLSLYNATWLSTISGNGLQWDDDHYEIEVPSGYERVYVYVNFTHADGDIDITLLDDMGWGIEGSYSFGDSEEVNYTVTSSGTYYIQVHGENAGNEYDLYWECTPPPPIPDDNYEENDDFFSAYNLTDHEYTWLSHVNGSGVYLDDDFYEIYVPSGREYLHVTAPSQSEGFFDDLYVYLYNSTLDLLGSTSGWMETNLEQILPAGGGVYYLKINGSGIPMTYDLMWWTTDPTPPFDDAYEDNDDQGSAYNVTDNEFLWLSSIYGKGRAIDEDWYEIAVQGGFEYLEILFEYEIGTLDINLYHSNGTFIESFAESLRISTPAGGGVYYINVQSSNMYTLYDFTWNTTSLPADDAYEENDNNATAYNITSNEGAWLSSISGEGTFIDVDYYQLNLSVANPVIELQVNVTGGEIEFAVLDESLMALLYCDVIQNSTFLCRILASEVHYVRITGPVAGASYDFKWTASPLPSDDSYEENDDPGSPTNLTTHAGTWLSSINGSAVLLDDDFYLLEVPSGHGYLELNINITFYEGMELLAIIYDQYLTEIVGAGLNIISDNLDAGIYCSPGMYILHFYDGSFNPLCGVSYDLRYTTSALPVDDNYAFNGNRMNAYNLTAHEGAWLSSINGTGLLYGNITGSSAPGDYYEFQVTGPLPERVQIELLSNLTRAPIFIGIVDPMNKVMLDVTDLSNPLESHKTEEVVLYPGTYYIMLTSQQYVGQEYDLKWESSPVTTIPDAPVDVSPANGSTVPTDSPLLMVQVTDPDGDRLTVVFYNASDDSLLGAGFGVPSGGIAVAYTIALPEGVPITWYVVVMDDYLYQYSDNFTFTYISTNNPPSAPVLQAPLNESVVMGTSQELIVQVSDPDLNSLDVYFFNASDDSLIGVNFGVSSGSNASVTWLNLAGGTNHTWYVVVDDMVNLTYSGNFTFTAYSGNPNEPILVSPANSSRTGEGNLVLEVLATHQGGMPMNVTFYNASDNSVIATDYNVASGTIASVTWPGLPNGISCSWYAIADDGLNQNQSATWSFDTNQLPTAVLNSPLNDSRVSLYDHIMFGTPLEVNVTDPESDVMDVYFYNASDDTLIDVDMGVASGSTASILAPAMLGGEALAWYVIVDDGYSNVTEGFWLFAVNDLQTYNVTSPANSSVVIGQDVLLSLDVVDFDGDTMDVYFYNASDDSLIGIDSGVPSGNSASYLWNSLTLGASYTWYAILDDGYDMSSTLNYSFRINTPPDPAYDELPPDNFTWGDTSPWLWVNVSDPDGDTLDVYFYDALFDTLIGSDMGITNGSVAYAIWSGLTPGLWYDWYVIVSDGLENTTTGNFTFYLNLAPDVAVNPQPANGTTILNRSTVLSVDVSDSDDSFLYVIFYNATDHSVIGVDGAAMNGSRIYMPWTGLTRGVTYSWYVSVWDLWNETNSSIWSFTVALDDAYEENDVMGSAFNLSAQEGVNLTDYLGYGIQSDEDWFEIQVAPGYEHVTINAWFNNSEGDIDLELYNSTGGIITASYSTNDHEYIDTYVLGAGTFYIRVYYGDNGNVYDLRWTTSPGSTTTHLIGSPSPVNDSVVSETDVNLTARVTDPEGDLLYVYFMEIVGYYSYIPIYYAENVTNGTLLSHVWTGRTPGQQYRWTVIINDNSSTYINPDFVFSVNLLPAQPTGVTPANGSVVTGTSTILNMTVTDAESSTLDVTFYDASNNSVIGIQLGVANNSNAFVPWTPLMRGASYSWYAVISDGLNTTTTGVYVFTVNHLPSVGMLNTPANDTVLITTSTLLSITPVDLDGGTITVTFHNSSSGLQIGTPQVVTSGFPASVTWLGLEIGGNHSWHVILDDGFETINSTSWVFKVNTIPNAPVLQAPITGASLEETSAELRVLVVDLDGDPVNVTFYNALDNSTIGIAVNITNGSTASITWTGLEQGKTFQWFVMVDDGYQQLNSSVWGFSIKEAKGFDLVVWIQENMLLVIIGAGGLVAIVAVGAIASKRKKVSKTAVKKKEQKKGVGKQLPDYQVGDKNLVDFDIGEPKPAMQQPQKPSMVKPKPPVMVARPNRICTSCNSQYTIQGASDSLPVICPKCQVPLTRLEYCPNCNNPLVLSVEYLTMTKGKNIQCSYCSTSFDL